MTSNIRPISAFTASNLGTGPGSGSTAMLMSRVRQLRLSRIASRKRRLIRLRITALPCLRPTIMAYPKDSAGAHTSLKPSPASRRPNRSNVWMSRRLLILRRRGSLFFTGNPDSQSLPSFGAAAFEDVASALGGHALPEAVVVHFLSVTGLKSTFHFPISTLTD